MRKKAKSKLRKIQKQSPLPELSPEVDRIPNAVKKEGLFYVHVTRFWWCVGALATILGLVCAYCTLRPKVSVELGAVLDPKNPLTARFEIRNDGELSIYDVYPHAVWIPFTPPMPTNGFRFIFWDTGKFTRIAPGTKTVCHFDDFRPTNPLPPSNNYQIQIVIVYTPALWPKSVIKTFQFSATKNSAENFDITPYGGGGGVESVKAFLSNPAAH